MVGKEPIPAGFSGELDVGQYHFKHRRPQGDRFVLPIMEPLYSNMVYQIANYTWSHVRSVSSFVHDCFDVRTYN